MLFSVLWNFLIYTFSELKPFGLSFFYQLKHSMSECTIIENEKETDDDDERKKIFLVKRMAICNDEKYASPIIYFLFFHPDREQKNLNS